MINYSDRIQNRINTEKSASGEIGDTDTSFQVPSPNGVAQDTFINPPATNCSNKCEVFRVLFCLLKKIF